MKIKVQKVKSASTMQDCIDRRHTFKITGPSARTGERVTVIFEGTREEAAKVELK